MSKIKNIFNFFNLNRQWFYCLSVLFLVFLGIKYYQFQANHLAQIQSMLIILPTWQIIGLLFLLIILMFFNWFAESLKLYFLLPKNKEFGIITCFKSTFAGISASLLLPNRAGEFIGRNAILFNNMFHPNGIFISLYASAIQQLVTCSAAFVSFAFLAIKYELAYQQIIVLLSVLVSVMLSVILVLPTKYFIKIASKKMRYELGFSNITFLQKFTVFLIAIVRYTIFSAQVYLVISLITQSSFEPTVLIGLIAIYFFIISYVPTHLYTEAIVRYGVAVAIFTNAAASVAVILVWSINVLIPAFLGSIILFFQKSKQR